MNIKRAKEEIKNTIEAYLLKEEHGRYMIPLVRQRPVLLIGPPGVGKTQVMEQVSRECGIGLAAYTITHHTRQSAIGLPFIMEKTYGGVRHSVTEYTMSEIVASIYDRIEETGLREGILFIDEINCVSETLAPAMLQLLQGKSFGNHRIPEGWIIVGAGNPPEFNKSVRDFDVVTLDRVKMIHVEADYEVWKDYAYQEALHPAVISYLNVSQENFCRIETTVDGKRFATPRGWEDLSRLIEVYEKLGRDVDREVVEEYLQFPSIAKDFANYLELYYKYENDYQVEEILSGVLKESLCNRIGKAPFDEKLSVTSLLLSRLNNKFGEVLASGERLELLQEEIRAAEGEISQENGSGAARVWREQTERFRVDWEKRRSAGLLNRREDGICQEIVSRMEQYGRELTTARGPAWERMKSLFEAEAQKYEEEFSKAADMLEHAFDFIEASFGDGQEAVIFITELNRGYYSVKFLQEYECERYYQYNQRLLFRERGDVIAEKIEKLGI